MTPSTTPEATEVACPNCLNSEEIAQLASLNTKHPVTLRRSQDGIVDVCYGNVGSEVLYDTAEPLGFWCNSCDHQFGDEDIAHNPRPAQPGERQTCRCGCDRFEQCVTVNAYAQVRLIAGRDPEVLDGDHYEPAWDTAEPDLIRCMDCGNCIFSDTERERLPGVVDPPDGGAV